MWLTLGSEIKNGEDRVRNLKTFAVNSNSVWLKICVQVVSPTCENKIANKNLEHEGCHQNGRFWKILALIPLGTHWTNNQTLWTSTSRSSKIQNSTRKQMCSQQIVHFKMVGKLCCIFHHMTPTPSLAWWQFWFWSLALSHVVFDPEGGMLILLTNYFVKPALPGRCQLGCLKSAVGIGDFRNRQLKRMLREVLRRLSVFTSGWSLGSVVVWLSAKATS